MLKNPKPSKEVLDFYNLLQADKSKYWYDFTQYKFALIAEKPSQIQAIVSVLPKGKHIKIVSLSGHIMELNDFEDYDATLKSKSWYKLVKDKNVPFIPTTFKNKVKSKSTGKFKSDYGKIYLNMIDAADEADFIISCTDPDNEGASLFYQPIEKSGNLHKVLGQINMSKLDFFSLQEEIKTFDVIEYFKMAQAGIARSEFDWTFGLNNTILASVLLGGGTTYHIGGVKSPVLRMVYDRIKSVENFKSEKYWQFSGSAKHLKTSKEFNYIVKVKQDNVEILKTQKAIDLLEMKINGLDKEKPESLVEINNFYEELNKLRWNLSELTKEFETSERDIYNTSLKNNIEEAIKNGLRFKVTNFETTKGLTRNPPLAYSLTDLQAEAGSLHNFTPAKTLEIAQKLYEGQYQSYPRTDSRYYAVGEMSNIKKIIPNLLSLATFSHISVPTPYKAKTGVFNSSKVSAHTGLAPTTKDVKDSSLNGEMKTIYDMVATRYLIQFMDKFEYYQVKLDADVGAQIYITAQQNVEINKGWKELYDTNIGFSCVKKQTLPNMLIGDEIEILTIERSDLETKPQPMFNDFSLLKGMERISRIYPELEGLERGIGTPATRASILEQLFKAKYLIKKGRIVDLSSKAKTLIGLLPEDMTSPKLRADMEHKLEEIISGKLTKKDYEKEFTDLIIQQTQQLYDVASTHKIEATEKEILPPSDKQLKFAYQVAKELKLKIPKEVLELKDEMTKWLKINEKKMPVTLSEKQYAFLKEYGSDDKNVVAILEACDNKSLTKSQQFEASKWLGNFMKSSEFRSKRAKKAANTRKKK